MGGQQHPPPETETETRRLVANQPLECTCHDTGKEAVAVPWTLIAASPAYSGIANSWNCSAAFESPCHRLQGAWSPHKAQTLGVQTLQYL